MSFDKTRANDTGEETQANANERLRAMDLLGDYGKIRLWKALCENATLAMFVMDEQQHCIYMNGSAERLTGYTLAETLGRPLHDVLHHTRPDGSPFPLEECPIDRAFPEKHREQGEEVFVHKDGSFYPVAYTASPLEDDEGRPIGTIIEVRSIAEEKATAERLTQTERRLQFALAAGRAIGTWEWDIQADTMRTDARFARMFGIDKGRAGEGMPLASFLAAIHEEDRPRVEAAIAEAVESGEEFEEEYRVTTADGEEAWLLARGKCFRDADGGPDRFPGVAVDITTQRAHLARLQLLADELNHRVKNTLQTVQAIAVHSLRGRDGDASRHDDFVARIQALSALHNLLTESQWEKTDLESVLEMALAPYRQDEERGGGDRFACEGPFVPLTPQRSQVFSMALHELATNAAKYGALLVRTGSVSVRWSFDADTRELRLVWRESGGPEVARPEREGFGTLMLTRILARDIQGAIKIEYPPEGVVCEITGTV
ncbi:PAS domain S-box protein [Parvularcula oceani]|uniref:PAS domain S-box protein n=1 Tax=Parvularcula oceani TaxID=1247963 RepID=UPI0004E0EC0C|nr:PAS domain S-box protein [Parvularcula oceani]